MKRVAILWVAMLSLPALASATEEAAKEGTTKEAAKEGTTKEAAKEGATEEAATGGTFEIAAIKVCSGVEAKECTAEQATFNTGDKAWVWLKLKPKSDSATISMKWSRDGKHIWTMGPEPVTLGRTWYYKTFDQPGEWQVEIIDDTGTALHMAKATATGNPVHKAPEGTAAAAGALEESKPSALKESKPSALGESKPGALGESKPGTLEESTHVAVVDLKLAEQIKDREPVSPGTTFTSGAKVYTWVKLNVKEPETSVKLKWYRGDALVYTSDTVTVKQSPGWRTWLYKTVKDTGTWKVEVVDADDKAVHRQEFTVQ